MELVIDHRESQLIEKLNALQQTFVVKCLDVGDIHIALRVDDNVHTIAIIERKTLPDLAQSINDGRYRDQKYRMLDNYERSKIMYIIEGDAFNASATERCTGAILNTMLRDDIKVLCVPDVCATASIIMDIVKRVTKNPDKFINVKSKDVSVPIPKPHSKSSYMSMDSFGVSALSLIQGVSPQIAKLIMEEYENNFCKLVNACDISVISEIKVASGRRIGKKVAGRIVSYIKQNQDLPIAQNAPHTRPQAQ